MKLCDLENVTHIFITGISRFFKKDLRMIEKRPYFMFTQYEFFHSFVYLWKDLGFSIRFFLLIYLFVFIFIYFILFGFHLFCSFHIIKSFLSGWTNNENDEVENSCNSLWRLHLPTLTWEMLHPEGTSPYSCDKAACWVYKNRYVTKFIYLLSAYLFFTLVISVAFNQSNRKYICRVIVLFTE